jgi:hypothetical protein
MMSWRPKRYWHTQILAVLKRTRAFYLPDVRHTPDEVGELTQAAAELATEGKIRLVQPAAGFGAIVYRPTDGVPDPITVRRLSGVSR